MLLLAEQLLDGSPVASGHDPFFTNMVWLYHSMEK